MRKKIEKSDTRLPNTFRQTEPDIRAYTVDDIYKKELFRRGSSVNLGYYPTDRI